MISLVDMCGMCGLDLAEIEAIAEHEHLPDVAAAALASYLLHSAHGADYVRDMIIDDIHTALEQGRKAHAGELVMALRHFCETHPELYQ
jgi:hypothetical protein